MVALERANGASCRPLQRFLEIPANSFQKIGIPL